MTIALAYFSGTGHTKLVAEEYRKNFISISDVTLYDVAKEKKVDLHDFDYVGIIYPIHAFNPPEIVYQFVKSNNFNNVTCFISKDSGEPLKFNDGSSNRLIRKIKKDGGKVLSELHVLMPYNILKRHTDEMAIKMFQAMQVFVKKHCDEIIEGKQKKLDFSLFNVFISWIFRLEWKGAKIIGKSFTTNDLCVKCFKCEEICPNSNISHDFEGMKFGRNCSLCMRCAFSCPYNAIETGILKRWKVNGKYNFEGEQVVSNDLQAFVGEKKKYRFYREYFEKAEKIEKKQGEQNI